MKRALLLAITLVAFSCDGFIGDFGVRFKRPRGPTIPIVQPDYVVLRPVSETPSPGAGFAVDLGRTLYFNESERVLDLRHLDPRTAEIDRRQDGTYVVWISTTDVGDELLGNWTAANVERQVGVFVDGKLICAPVVKSRITGGIVIEAQLTNEQASQIVARLRRGGAAV